MVYEKCIWILEKDEVFEAGVGDDGFGVQMMNVLIWLDNNWT